MSQEQRDEIVSKISALEATVQDCDVLLKQHQDIIKKSEDELTRVKDIFQQEHDKMMHTQGKLEAADLRRQELDGY